MTNERLKKLMEDVGMPDSRSLLVTLQQVANEVEQETLNNLGEGWICKACEDLKTPCFCASQKWDSVPPVCFWNLGLEPQWKKR